MDQLDERVRGLAKAREGRYDRDGDPAQDEDLPPDDAYREAVVQDDILEDTFSAVLDHQPRDEAHEQALHERAAAVMEPAVANVSETTCSAAACRMQVEYEDRSFTKHGVMDLLREVCSGPCFFRPLPGREDRVAVLYVAREGATIPGLTP